MNRNRNIVVVCHCILNCNSKVEGLSEFDGAINISSSLIEKGFGLIQLPCPEMILYGIKRWGHTSEQFDNMFYRSQCRDMLMPYIMQFENYLRNNYDIKGIIAIDGSPSCGYNKTCSSPKWFGELGQCPNLGEILDDISLIDGKGIFMDVLYNMLKEFNINIPIYGLDESNLSQSSLDILNSL